MIWRRWWRRQHPVSEKAGEAVQAQRQAELQSRFAKLQGNRVDRAICAAQDAAQQVDQLAREMERAMRPRGV